MKRDTETVKQEKINKESLLEAYDLVGGGTSQQVVEGEIIFAPPEKDRVTEIISVERRLNVSDITVGTDIVLLNGDIYKSIIYKTVKAENVQKDNKKDNSQENKDDKEKENKANTEKDNEEDDNKTLDEDGNKGNETYEIVENDNVEFTEEDQYSNQVYEKKFTYYFNMREDHNQKSSIIMDGVVRHTTIRTPFKTFVFVNGAKEGDEYQVVSSKLINEFDEIVYDEDNNDEDNNTQSMDAAKESAISEPRFIKGIINKDLIEISITVIRYKS